MNKLLKLKKWMTLEEASRYLTEKLEPVGVADVLQFALDGHLTLSVDLVNRAQGKSGTLMKAPAAAKAVAEGNAQNSRVMGPYSSFIVDGDDVMVVDEKVRWFAGVWDLAGWGGEKIALQNMRNELIGAPAVLPATQAVTWLRNGDRDYYELYEPYPADYGDPAMVGGYYRATGLPKGSMLVVRVPELQRFISTYADGDDASAPVAAKPKTKPNDSPLAMRERNNLLCIIGVLCHEAKIPIEKNATAAAMIANTADRLGVRLPDSTIKKHLKAAAEELGSRTK